MAVALTVAVAITVAVAVALTPPVPGAPGCRNTGDGGACLGAARCTSRARGNDSGCGCGVAVAVWQWQLQWLQWQWMGGSVAVVGWQWGGVAGEKMERIGWVLSELCSGSGWVAVAVAVAGWQWDTMTVAVGEWQCQWMGGSGRLQQWQY
jgi:hypothetical protein